MMLQWTDEQAKLHKQLKTTTDPEEQKKIRKRLREISKEIDEELKDCPFVH